MIVVNFKTYPHVEGEGAVKLARICEKVANDTGVEIVVCPPMVELSKVAGEVDIPVFSQNADFPGGKASTGATSLAAIKAAGGSGTLINHSEKRLKLADIGQLVEKAREMGLETIVCSNDSSVSKAVAALNPDFVAMEPPELIGGDISVTSADPAIVEETVRSVGEIDPDMRVLTGAGVKNGEDVEAALKLGTLGVLIASGVVKADDPESVLRDLALPMTEQ